MSILKRTMYIQAVQFGNCGEFKVNLFNQELINDAYTTAITLGTFEVEFEVDDYSQNEFRVMKQEQLAKVKEDIMNNAIKQCAALDTESGWGES